MYIKNIKQGSSFWRAERKYSNFDPLPDADNAAVGSCITVLQRLPHRRSFSFEKGKLFHSCGESEGSASDFVFSDGKPCCGVRGHRKCRPIFTGACLFDGVPFHVEMSLYTDISDISKENEL